MAWYLTLGNWNVEEPQCGVTWHFVKPGKKKISERRAWHSWGFSFLGAQK